MEVEIKHAIWHLDPIKASGLDGFPISFYIFFWDLIKYDLKHVLQYAQSSFKLGRNTNSSFLAMIPKEVNPSIFS
jgi:hypothetical protein